MIIMWLLFKKKKTATLKFKFLIIMSISQLCAKAMNIHKIMQKLWLKFEYMRNFVQKKMIHFGMILMQNFLQKRSFRAKTRSCCARESIDSWKPYTQCRVDLKHVLWKKCSLARSVIVNPSSVFFIKIFIFIFWLNVGETSLLQENIEKWY